MTQPTSDPVMSHLANATERVSALLLYVTEENYMSDTDAKHKAIEALRSLALAMGEIERLF